MMTTIMNCKSKNGLLLRLLYLQSIFNLAQLENDNLDSLEKLRQALNQSNNSIIAFYTNANVVSTRSLFKGVHFNYTLVNNNSLIIQGVKNGSYIAGCLIGISEEDNTVLNVIRSGIIEGHAIFTLPDVSSEYPHGAAIEASGKEFRNAINLAIMRMQAQGIDFDLAAKYHENIVDVRTCKIDNTDEFPIPNRVEATGLLKTVLEKSIVLVGSFGNLNSTKPDEGDQEFSFHSAYLNAILDEFAQLRGPDGIAYGRPNVRRVYARSSTANLLRGRVYMTEPYFLIDNVYTGSQEPCTSNSDCVKANTASGYESCTNNTCIGYTRPISEIFKLSCLTYGTEALFITKKINNEHVANQSNTKIPGGVLAALILLAVSLTGTIVLLVFMALKERRGKPLFG
ncbi:unnamed protein product [Rotaria sp. Silwood1]|nr:unnamed protein product [Rotaria sp. Silwood1]CAF1509590.1 unnamed protein product [Rotaria sp. Silwood1]CAF3599773.1 unnamed protein product [Rotaria sp. Silwood1]CAF3622375.1 unnamed protein product [Rotaria sp. Silwood1]CAF4597669.1 unnamed protein product [Rotaria sp. Silwood1]